MNNLCPSVELLPDLIWVWSYASLTLGFFLTSYNGQPFRYKNTTILIYFSCKLVTHSANFQVDAWSLEKMVYRNHPLLILSILLWFSLLPYFGWYYFCVAEVEGLKRKLTSKLGGNSAALVPDWKVVSCFPLHFFCWWWPDI